MTEAPPNVVNIDEVAETPYDEGGHWCGPYKVLTPALTPRMGHLGVNATRVPPGKSACPLHTHQIADEVFFVLSGRGVFRYGDVLREVKAGDCISCPARSGVGHQFANPFDVDLVYLAIGMNDRNEVCTYPDSGKIMVDSLDQIGYLTAAEYYAGEPEVPRIFELLSQAKTG